MASAGDYCIEVKPYRLDCGCNLYGCEGSTDITGVEGANPKELSCLTNSFVDDNGRYDFNCDQVETEFSVLFEEMIGVCSATVNGEDIENLFCLLETEDCEIPSSGSFRYKDSWNIIYDVSWEYFANRIDITYTVFDPRVPGEPDEGFVMGHQVYRKGVITTTRLIAQLESDGSTTIIENAYVQKIDFFRVTFECGDTKFTDPFKWHLDCAVSDELEIEEVGTGTGSSSS